MQWTKDKPTVPGWYWISYKGIDPPDAVEIMYDDEWLLAVYYRGYLPLLSDEQWNDYLFFGPIDPPSLPEGNRCRRE